MNTNGRTRVEEPSVAASISGMAHNAIELAELQAQLFACDIKSSGQRARSSLLLCIVGVSLLLSAFPVLLIALAVLLNTQLDWPPAAGYAVAALVGLLVSGAILAFAYAQFKQGIVTLDRSREELSNNIAWLKTQLSRKRTPVDRIPIY